MKTELVQALTTTFEAYAQQTESGIEFWLARDLQHLLGYTKWDNFQNVVTKARTACEVSGHAVSDHFADVGKTITMPRPTGPNTAWIQSLIDTYKSKTYTSKHIRPLAVSPLNHPESVPTPWGFLISGLGIDACHLMPEVNT